ncbi:MAG: DMT family transporter [Chloroflexi bacterium]|nr:DMT family transporter [Chloroflexota bacterium]
MRAALVLLVGVVAVSFASIFIRWAEAPPLVIATYRLVLASLVVAPAALWRNRSEWTKLQRGDLILAAIAGVFLSAHFALWIASLAHTSVVNSVVLVATSPLFVALGSHLLGLDRLTRWMVGGLVLALAGGVAIGGGEGSSALRGNLLALGGALMAAGYLMIGRRIRRRVSLLTYIALVYSIAAGVSLVLVAATQRSLIGYSPNTYLMFVLLALVPQVIGHSAFNWALGYLSAPFVSLTVVGEPIGATLLAALLLGEIPSVVKLLGGALILAGVYLAWRGEWGSRPALSVAKAG